MQTATKQLWASALAAIVGVLANDSVVIAADLVDRALFDGFKIVELERGEELGAGVMCLVPHRNQLRAMSRKSR